MNVKILMLAALSLHAASAAQAVTVNVVDNDGNAVNGFRWTLQEDATFAVDPANPSTNPDELLSLGFHASYHPVAQNGNCDAAGAQNCNCDDVTGICSADITASPGTVPKPTAGRRGRASTTPGSVPVASPG
mgnify:CR=1 FL=1